MIDRLFKAIGYFLGIAVILIALGTSPIWLLAWIFTGFNIGKYITKKFNPEAQKRIDKINAETAEINKEIERLKQENEENDRIRREIDRIKRNN